MAGVRGIEPRSKVLETFILAVVLYPYKQYSTRNYRDCHLIVLFKGDEICYT